MRYTIVVVLLGRSAHASAGVRPAVRMALARCARMDGTSSGETATCRLLVTFGSPSHASLGLKWTLTSAARQSGPVDEDRPAAEVSAVNDRTYRSSVVDCVPSMINSTPAREYYETGVVAQDGQ